MHAGPKRIGARACLTKPFELDRLVELVERITVAPIAALTDERPALT